MSYVTDQEKWIKEVDLRVGDRVLVIASVEKVDGWQNVWSMDRSVGQERTVHTQMFQNDMPVHGIQLDDECGYPFFVLVKIN